MSYSYRFHPSMSYLGHCSVLVFLERYILGPGDVSDCVPAVALISRFSPCCGPHLRGGGKGGVLWLVAKPYGNDNILACWIIPDFAWFRARSILLTEILTSHASGRPQGAVRERGGGGCTVNRRYNSEYSNSLIMLPTDQ